MATFGGELPAVDQIGWGLVRDMQLGLKYNSESSLDASNLRLSSQYARTFFLIKFLYISFVAGASRSCNGWGRRYWRHNSRILKNHDLDDGVTDRKILCALGRVKKGKSPFSFMALVIFGRILHEKMEFYIFWAQKPIGVSKNGPEKVKPKKYKCVNNFFPFHFRKKLKALS
jgi:hypothetical protein